MDTISLPTTTGVYLFKHQQKTIYIGKSVNIKARVVSHLQNAKTIPKEQAMVAESDQVDFIVTDSEFKALLLEARLIRQYRPKYNVVWKDNKSYLYIKINHRAVFPKVTIVRQEDDHNAIYFGPFSSKRLIEKILRIIRRVVPYCSDPKIGKRACFYAKIGLCDPCPNRLSGDDYSSEDKIMLTKIYQRNIRQVIAILSGKTEIVQNSLYKALSTYSASKNYEEALILRNRLFLLDRLVKQQHFNQDNVDNYNQADQAIEELQTLLNLYFPKLRSLGRIECYDISNLAQQQIAGSMVVFVNGLSDRQSYRRFKINTSIHSDFEALSEVLKRRFRHSWPKPDLIVVDGGKPQLEAVKKVLETLSLSIPLIGLAKNPDRLVIKTNTFRLKNNDFGLNLLRQIRDESHRFAKKYHLLLRNKVII